MLMLQQVKMFNDDSGNDMFDGFGQSFRDDTGVVADTASVSFF